MRTAAICDRTPVSWAALSVWIICLAQAEGQPLRALARHAIRASCSRFDSCDPHWLGRASSGLRTATRGICSGQKSVSEPWHIEPSWAASCRSLGDRNALVTGRYEAGSGQASNRPDFGRRCAFGGAPTPNKWVGSADRFVRCRERVPGESGSTPKKGGTRNQPQMPPPARIDTAKPAAK